MFIIEAIPAVACGIALYLYLDNRPADAKWLSAEEKAIIERDIFEDESTKQSPHSISAVFGDKRLWHMCIIYFAFVSGQYGLTFWMPTLVKATGITGNFHIGLISAIPFICTIISMIVLGRSADRMRERRWHLIVPALFGALGFIVAATSTSTVIAVAFLSLAAAGVIACAPLFWSLPTAFLKGASAAVGIALINSVGNLAGFFSPYIIGTLRDVTGSGQSGMYALACMAIIGAVAVFLTPAKLVNR
jgi:nitrate/nitrite transporter NarK